MARTRSRLKCSRNSSRSIVPPPAPPRAAHPAGLNSKHAHRAGGTLWELAHDERSAANTHPAWTPTRRGHAEEVGLIFSGVIEAQLLS